MRYNFDQIINRQNTYSAKWEYFDEDVLPLWVADMDFQSPKPVIDALHERVEHGVFGYAWPPDELKELLCARMDRLYNWQVQPDEILFVPGLVVGFNVTAKAVGGSDGAILMQTPVYPPFLHAPENQNLNLQTAPLTLIKNGHTLRYEIDFDRFEAAFTPQTRMFLLCHPHNPVGREYTPTELSRMAEICLRHKAIICSDEIHSELLMGDTKHTPIATLSPEIADRCVTLVSPSKTFNLPGLGCGMVIVQNAELRQQLETAMKGVTGHVNLMGYVAATAAFKHGDDWLSQMLAYVNQNLAFTIDYVQHRLPGITTTVPEATYLTWLDCRDVLPNDDPFDFFFERAKVAVGNGKDFGTEGIGFIRLNFACPRSMLEQSLNQMRQALVEAGALAG